MFSLCTGRYPHVRTVHYLALQLRGINGNGGNLTIALYIMEKIPFFLCLCLHLPCLTTSSALSPFFSLFFIVRKAMPTPYPHTIRNVTGLVIDRRFNYTPGKLPKKGLFTMTDKAEC
jgi:hypothetical protein